MKMSENLTASSKLTESEEIVWGKVFSGELFIVNFVCSKSSIY